MMLSWKNFCRGIVACYVLIAVAVVLWVVSK